MESQERHSLVHCRAKIVEDLDVSYVIDVLLSKNILNVDDKERIYNKATQRDRARQLLDILPLKGPTSYSVFVDSLTGPYPWLAKSLECSKDGLLWGGDGGSKDLQRQAQDLLLKGGVPQPPPHHISRKEKVTEMKNALQHLERNNFLVIHGMPGSGKTVLAAKSVSSPQIVIDVFQGGIYWLPIGNVKQIGGKDALLSKMKFLIEKLEEVGNAQSIDQATDILRKAFLKDYNRNSLLILDDVWSAEVVKALDIGCRILVSTRDSGIMDVIGKRYQVVSIDQGFTEEESLNYFSDCLDMKFSDLPDQARELHIRCKGNPMVISLLGAMLEENKDDVKRNYGRWQYYVDTLSKRKYSKLRRLRTYEHESVSDAIGMSIDNLPKVPVDYYQYYQDFAVFVDDVNISTEVLMTLWNMDRYEVEDIMSTFVRKSLAVSKYSNNFQGYVYGIHDLQLDYLKFRARTDNIELKVLHEKLIRSYLKKCGNVISELPNDNYIYLYLGYHLMMAEMTDLFTSTFLDLAFVESKLHATSPSDLLRDYKKYEIHIAGMDKKLQKSLSEFEDFVRMYGHVIVQNKDSDVIQMALRMPKDTSVYKAAISLANSTPHRFYVQWLNMKDMSMHQPSETLICGGHVHSISFTKDENRVVAAVGEAPVKLYSLDTGRDQHSFRGHAACVTCLSVSPDGVYLATSSLDGLVKIWDLNLVLFKLDNEAKKMDSLQVNGVLIRTPSPCSMQESWHDMFSMGGTSKEDTSWVTLEGHNTSVNWVSWSPSNRQLVSGDNKGTAILWDIEMGKSLHVLKGHKDSVTCCLFSACESLVGTSSQDTTLKLWCINTGQLHFAFTAHSLRVMRFLFLPLKSLSSTHGIISSTDNQIFMWQVPKLTTYTNGNDVHNQQETRQIQKFIRNKSALYLSLALSLDGTLLASGTSDHRIILWDVQKVLLIRELTSHNGWVTCLNFWMGHDKLLLSGSEDETIMTWEVDQISCNQLAMKSSNFYATWNFRKLFAVFPNDRYCIEVQKGRKVIYTSDPESSRIILCCSSETCDTVAFGCENGVVKILDLKTKLLSQVAKHDTPICSLGFGLKNLTLVSTANDGSVKIIEKGVVIEETTFPNKIFKVFFDSDSNGIIACSEKGILHIWNCTTKSWARMIDVSNETSKTSIAADFIPHLAVLALGTISGTVHIIALNSGFHTSKHYVDNVIRTCRFSPNGKLLAVGYDSGLTLVWNIESDSILGELVLHKSWVRDIRFSRDSCLLVTVGDQIGWWNLVVLEKQKTAPQRRHSGGGVRRRQRSGDNHTNASSVVSELLVEGFRIGRKGKRELLQCFDLQGSFVSRIYCNDEFTNFVTVDDAGTVYVLGLLENSSIAILV